MDNNNDCLNKDQRLRPVINSAGAYFIKSDNKNPNMKVSFDHMDDMPEEINCSDTDHCSQSAADNDSRQPQIGSHIFIPMTNSAPVIIEEAIWPIVAQCEMAREAIFVRRQNHSHRYIVYGWRMPDQREGGYQHMKVYTGEFILDETPQLFKLVKLLNLSFTGVVLSAVTSQLPSYRDSNEYTLPSE